MTRLLYPNSHANFRWYNILLTLALRKNKHQYESIRLDQEDNTAYGFCRLSSDNGLIVMLYATEEE